MASWAPSVFAVDSTEDTPRVTTTLPVSLILASVTFTVTPSMVTVGLA